jgi:hypothetical protein
MKHEAPPSSTGLHFFCDLINRPLAVGHWQEAATQQHAFGSQKKNGSALNSRRNLHGQFLSFRRSTANGTAAGLLPT